MHVNTTLHHPAASPPVHFNKAVGKRNMVGNHADQPFKESQCCLRQAAGQGGNYSHADVLVSFFREATRVGAVLTLWFAACHSPHPAQASFLIHPVGSKFHFVVSCLCEAMSEIKPKQKKKKNAVCPFNTIIALIDYTLNYALKMLTQLIMSGLELRLSL